LTIAARVAMYRPKSKELEFEAGLPSGGDAVDVGAVDADAGSADGGSGGRRACV